MKRALLFLLLAPALLSAQDRIGTRLDWTNVVVLLYPDVSHGMQLTISTVPGGRTASGAPIQARGAGGGFDPDSVFEWINSAAKVMRPGTDPSGPDRILVTPTLRSASGDSIRLMRRANGGSWARMTTILIDEPGPQGDHFDVLVEPRMVQELLQGLQREAGLSGFDPDSVATRLRSMNSADSLIADDIPSVISTGKIRYPDRSKGGRIILQFVVRTDGLADPESIRTIYADYAVFQDWARPMITGARFHPGRLRGQPVDVLVQQAINFVP